jgi:hypothetical protein
MKWTFFKYGVSLEIKETRFNYCFLIVIGNNEKRGIGIGIGVLYPMGAYVRGIDTHDGIVSQAV